MVVPYAAGGPVGRIMAQALGEVLGLQIIVENVGGMTGANRVATAAPDGKAWDGKETAWQSWCSA